MIAYFLYLNEGRLEEGRRSPVVDQKDRKEPRGAKAEDVVSQAREIREEELQPAKRQERRHRFRADDRKEQIQRKVTLATYLQR